MNVIIVEDDDLMADLLETVVAGLHPALRVFKAFTVSEALDLWRSRAPGLFVIDWSLPDGTGLDVLRKIRAADKNMPVVMVTGRADRDSILKAAHYGISGYISKPFSVEMLHERLSGMLKAVLPEDTSVETLADMLSRKLESGLQIPTRMDVSGILGLMERAQDLSGGQLAERWQKEASLCARLLEVANRSSFRRTGEPVATVRDAISVMGVPMALSQALALALDTGSSFRSPTLAQSARHHQAQAEAVGSEAQKLALVLGKKALEFQTAGLLSRMGKSVWQHAEGTVAAAVGHPADVRCGTLSRTGGCQAEPAHYAGGWSDCWWAGRQPGVFQASQASRAGGLAGVQEKNIGYGE